MLSCWTGQTSDIGAPKVAPLCCVAEGESVTDGLLPTKDPDKTGTPLLCRRNGLRGPP